MNKIEFDRAMNALLLEVNESIVRDIRKIGHGYANDAFKKGWKAAEKLNNWNANNPNSDE